MFIALLFLSVTAEYLVSWDSALDPIEILSAGSWYSSTLMLSTNHAGETNAQATISFSATGVIPQGSYMQLTLPGFGSSPYQYYQTLQSSIPKGDDAFITFTSINLPTTAGAYGPVGIAIFESSSGQLLASSRAFTTVAVVGPLPSIISTMTVNFASGASTGVSTSTTLTINIPLSVSLQPYDYLNVTIDSNFGFGSLSSPVWAADSTSSAFNTTAMAYTPHVYNDAGAVTTQGSLMIYGLQTSLSSPSSISFSVSGFINPAFVGASPSWSAKVMRFGTSTVLQRFSGTGPAANTAGSVTGTWAPTNSYVKGSQIAAGAVIYMTLVFKPMHSIPSKGSVVITFAQASVEMKNVGTDSTNSINSYGIGSDSPFIDYSPVNAFSGCSYSSSAFTCTVSSSAAIAAGTSVSVFSIVTFTASTATVSVSTKTFEGKVIDSSVVATQTMAATSVASVLSEITAQFSSNKKAEVLSTNTAGQSGSSFTMFIGVKVNDNFSNAAVNLEIKLPVSVQSTAQDSAVSLVSGAYIYGYSDNSLITNFAGGGQADFSSTTVGTNSITTNSNTLKPLNNQVLSFQISAGSLTTPATFFLPIFSSSKSTRYEILVSYTNTANIFKYYSKPLTFTAPSFTSFTLKGACSNSNIPFMPAELSITPLSAWTPSSGLQAYIDFTITVTGAVAAAGTIGNNLGSGLSSGAIYPSTLATGSLYIVYSTEAAGISHILYTPGPGALSASAITFNIGLPGLTSAGTISASASLYANKTSDGTRFIMTSSGSSGLTTISAASGATSLTSPSLLQVPTIINARSVGVEVTTVAASPTTQTGSQNLLAFVVLEQGWGFSSTASLRVGAIASSASGSALTVLSSADPNLRWNLGFASSFAYIAASSIQAKITSVNAPWYSSAAANIYLGIGKSAGFVNVVAGSACEFTNSNKVPVNSLSMPVQSYSPLSSEGLGANVQRVDLRIVLSLPGPITAGSTFNVDLGSDFGVSGCAWTVTSGSFNQSGVVSGSTFSTTSASLTSGLSSGGSVSIIVFGASVPVISINNTVKAGFVSVSVKSSVNDLVKPSNTYMSYTDSTDGGNFNTRTTFSIGGASTGLSAISILKAIPSYKGAKAVHFQIKFTLNLKVASGSILTLTGEEFLSDSNLMYNVWATIKYSSVSINGKSLVFLISQDIPSGTSIEIRKDRAFDIPTNASAWLITVGYGGSTTNIIKDTLLNNKILISEASTASVTGGSIAVALNNMASQSDHTFKFVPLVPVTPSTWIVLEAPPDYDNHIGPYIKYLPLPTFFWLTSNSSLSANVQCSSSHWVIICTGITAAATATIDITITLWNPPSLTASWNIYIMSSGFNVMSNALYGVNATYSGLASPNIDLYNITHENPAAVSSTHKVYVKFSENYASASSVVMVFPDGYRLAAYNPKNIGCQASVSLSSGPINLIGPGSTCPIKGNTVTFNFTSATTLSGLWTTFQVNDVVNLIEGSERTEGIDVKSKLFNNYDLWSSSFILYSYSDATKTSRMTSMTYDNLNAGYTGYFAATWLSVSVNDGVRLFATPGTLSRFYDITTDNGKLSALNLKLVPEDNNNSMLKFDAKSYMLKIDRPSVSFRVGLPASAPAGYYYITWSVTETPLIPGKLRYQVPVKTIVKAFLNSETKVTVFCDPILSVSTRGSLPVAVYFAGGVTPYSTLELGLSVDGDSSNFTFTPASLVFNPGESIKYFSLASSEGIFSGKSYNVQFKLNGTDSAAFTLQSTSKTFTVGTLYNSSAGINVTLTTSSKSDAVIKVDTDSAGTATWALVSARAGSDDYDYDFLISVSEPLVGEANENQTSVEQQFKEWDALLSEINDSDWVIYATEVLLLGEYTFFYGQTYVSSGSGQIIQSFDNLIAQTSYTAAVWFDNLSGFSPSFGVSTASTSESDNIVRIDLVSGDTLSTSYSTTIATAIAASIFVNPLRITENFFSNSSRYLASTTSYLLLPSENTADKSIDIAKTLDPLVLYNNARSLGVPWTSAPEVTILEITPQSLGEPAMEDSYWDTSDSNAPIFNFTSGSNGVVCCGYQINDTTPLASYDIYFGINSNGDDIKDQIECTDVEAGENYTIIANLSLIYEIGNVTYSCTACNQYPIMPMCVDNSEVSSITIEWFNGTDSFGISVMAALLWVYLG